MKGIVLLIIAIIFIMIAFIVGFSNAESITINYVIAQTQLRISAFMVICLAIGFFFGFATILSKYFALKLRFANLKRKLEKLTVDNRE